MDWLIIWLVCLMWLWMWLLVHLWIIKYAMWRLYSRHVEAMCGNGKVRHVEAVLPPCGGGSLNGKVRHVEAVLPPCGGGMVILVIIYVWYSNCVCVLGEWFTLYGFSRVPLWTCMGKGLHVGGRGHRG